MTPRARAIAVAAKFTPQLGLIACIEAAITEALAAQQKEIDRLKHIEDKARQTGSVPYGWYAAVTEHWDEELTKAVAAQREADARKILDVARDDPDMMKARLYYDEYCGPAHALGGWETFSAGWKARASARTGVDR
jgi:hypothetical protein